MYNTTEPTVTPVNDELFIARAQTLCADIRKYLVHLAEKTKTPIELSIHARPQCIATDIRAALLAREQHFMLREEEFAARECADPHSACSIDTGRQGLASFIAGIVVPLADNTWAQEVHVDIKIGHELPSPFAAQGMAVCVTFDCKHGTVRQRFAPAQETNPPVSENDVTLGMTLICRPEKIGIRQVREETGRGDIMKLLQSDASLYRWTLYALLILGNLKASADLLLTEEQQKVLKQAADALRVIIVSFQHAAKQKAAIEAADLMSAEMPAEDTLSPGSLPFVDELHRVLESIKHISPALGEAVEHFEEALERSSPADTESPQPLSHPHLVHHDMLGLAPEES